MKIKNFYLTVFCITLILIVASCSAKNESETESRLDAFAKCLSDNGIKMYGAYWCTHCNNQKQMFAESWKYVNYIECSLPNRAGQTQICSGAGINAYPTWEFANGDRIEGGLSLGQLSLSSNFKIEK